MTDDELRLVHPPRKCQTRECTHGLIEPVAGKLDQAQGTLAAVVFACECGWTRTEAQQPIRYQMNGWTASISPCRRKNDVQAR